MKNSKKIYASHIRSEGDTLIESIHEAAKIAKYLGEDVSAPTLEELDLLLTPAEHVLLHNAVVKAVIKSVPGLSAEKQSEWTDEERQAITGAPHPDEDEEKN